MRNTFWLLILLGSTLPLGAAEGLDYYLPDDVTYDPSVPPPATILGYEVGEWHVRHDQLIEYFRAVAAASPRVQLAEYARSHEQRPLVMATISSPPNLANLESIRTRHLEALSGGGSVDAASRPVVTWLGYSVHGNESSGANASLLALYHLAAGQGPEIDALLEKSVVLLDPCLNPDGLARFAHWANIHRGRNLVGDPQHREHREVWPGGRTNHYWFDLNRDWLLLTHPESRGRLTWFHRWRPNVLTDFHEMGSNSTYFFQPGVPTRQNPNTPETNLDLTREIAQFHARILDEIGSLYYTEESFDDFYYGKGSTYPDVNGCIGILFEQASSRGHLQESSYGPLTFPFTIRNQFRTTLSTLRAAASMRERLLEYQAEFYRGAEGLAEKDPVRAYVFGASHDAARNHHLVDILLRHDIEVHRLGKRIRNEGEVFEPEHAYVVPTRQPQYRLLKSIFEKRTEFLDETFYDVSSWTMPLSFGIPAAELTVEEFSPELEGERVDGTTLPAGTFTETADAYGYLFEWDGYYAPRALNRLLDAEIQARVATRPFEIDTASGRRSFGYGTIFVPMGPQTQPRETIVTLLRQAAESDGVDVFAVGTGLTPGGIDLGSPSMREVKPVKPIMLVGSGIAGYEAGEVWHLLDTRYDMEISMVEIPVFEGLDLDDYTHLVLVSGSYAGLGEGARNRLRQWIRDGGVVVATRGAVTWVERTLLARTPAPETGPGAKAGPTAGATDTASESEPKTAEEPAYADFEKLSAQDRVSGTIFEARLDLTHPLAFGYRRPTLPVFRNSTTIMAPETDPFATVARYTDTPLLSGFVSDENLAKISGSAVASATRLGRGTVIRIVDNPNFRGVWYGTSKLFVNGLFFGSAIKNTRALRPGR